MKNQLGATEYPASPEHQPDSAKVSREIGAKILTQANFESRQKDIVESSFNKAQRQGERLPGKNNERRNYAYLSRLENLIDKYGTEGEKHLWRQSADKLIVKPEDIPDSYWKSQEQILRDNGQGRELSTQEKDLLTNEIINNQKESIASWSNYLGDEHSPYPLWFKVYAFDGVSKMGVFDKDKKQFTKRDSHTVAPFPKLNASVLAKVYNAVSSLYGEPNPTFTDETNPGDDEIKELAKSGSFNKLYSYVLLKEKPIPKTPERTEDVHGEWIEYLPGEEENLAAAAEGTPWCIANPSTGRSYLEYGSYQGHDNHSNDEPNENQAKFILFHLQDTETGTLSPNACASIRLDRDGNVAEISGLNNGQDIEDSLVPIIEEKTKSLPGGERFLEAFADKQKLMRLDRKMQNEEDLTIDELEFIYEINRKIKMFNDFSDKDPRISQLKNKYGVEYALKTGVDANQLISNVEPKDIIRNLDAFTERNVDIDINHLMDELHYSHELIDQLETLLSHEVQIEQIVPHLHPSDIVSNLDILADHDAQIDIAQLMDELHPTQIVKNLDVFIHRGVQINEIVSALHHSHVLISHLDELLSHEAQIEQIVYNLHPRDIVSGLDVLADHNVSIDIDELINKLDGDSVASHLNKLLHYNADADMLVSRIDARSVLNYIKTLASYGADIGKMLDKINNYGARSRLESKHIDRLLSIGADIDDEIIPHLDSWFVGKNIGFLLSRGANADKILPYLRGQDLFGNIPDLARYGASLTSIERALGHQLPPGSLGYRWYIRGKNKART